MTSYVRRLLRASAAAHAALLLAIVPALGAQGTDVAATFDRAGMVPVITRGYADRLGLRPPGWRVQGDYREVRVFKTDAEKYALVIEKGDGTMERMPLDAEQFESLRLEVETRVSVLSNGASASTGSGAAVVPPVVAGAAVVPATPKLAPQAGATAPAADANPAYAYRAVEPSKPAGGDFARNQLVLGGLLYGPLTAALVENGPASIATYMATVATTYFAVVRPSREGKFTVAQNRLATGMAVGGAVAGAALSYTLGLGSTNQAFISDKSTLGFALAGAFAGAFTGTVLAKPMTDAEAEGINFGAGTGLLFASGILAATKGETAKGDARLIGGMTLAGLATGGYIGHEYASRVPYTVTSGDLTGLAAPALVGVLAGLTIAQPSASSSVTASAALTTLGMAAGLFAGDWFFVRRWDMTPEQGWLLNGGTIAGAGLMTAPFLLGNQKDAGVLFGAAAVGGALGAWGITQLSSFAPGTMRSRPALGPSRVSDARTGPVQFDMTSALMAAGGVPGRHAVVSIRF